MPVRSASKLSLVIGCFFGLLVVTGGVGWWLASAFPGEPWVTTALLSGFLVVLGGTGILFICLLMRQGRRIAVAGQYVTGILNGDYSEVSAEQSVAQIPAVGVSLVELVDRYKERLGFSRSILEGLPVPIVTVDTTQRVTFLNQECLDMLGATDRPEAFYGRNMSQIFYRDDRKSKIAECMENDTRAMNLEAVFVHNDGSDINILANLFPLYDVEGTIIGGCCLYLNTTDIKKKEAAIVSQNERIAKAASEATAVSEELAAASTQLEALVENARSGTSVQTDRTGETATAMEEMNATVLEVARHAQEAAIDANEAKEQAEEGAHIVTEVVAAINDVAENASELKRSMEELDGRAESIGKVLSVIEDIADQTNLLALNAAIEAARAGEAGRGFAVVADEVRKLAEKTMQATSEVHQAITGIQEGARKNVRATEVAVVSVEKSTEMAGKSGEALSSIVAVAESTADRVRAIATAAEEQSAASEEINQATMDVSRVCGDTDLVMIEAAEAITRLSQLADTLTGVVREMK